MAVGGAVGGAGGAEGDDETESGGGDSVDADEELGTLKSWYNGELGGDGAAVAALASKQTATIDERSRGVDRLARGYIVTACIVMA